jgi:hypothetical protein
MGVCSAKLECIRLKASPTERATAFDEKLPGASGELNLSHRLQAHLRVHFGLAEHHA